MTSNRFPLIPTGVLAEDASDSLAALVKKAKVQQAPKPKAKTPPESRKSMGLSHLVKAFKGSDKPAERKPSLPDLPPEKKKLSLPDGMGVFSKNSKGSSDKTPAERPGAISKQVSAPNLPLLKDPHMDVEHPTGKHEAFHHDTPSLKERTRPNVIPFDERNQDFHDRYHAKGASVKKIKYLSGSSGHVFHGEMDDGSQYIMKPHKHDWGERGVQAEQWHGRHDAVSRILSHMGADHMISPAVDTKGHGSDMLPSDHPSTERRGDRSAHSHAGQKAFATEYVQNAAHGHEATDMSHRVDQEHRLMGLVTHMVTVNSDGHGGNIMVDKEHGHPVLIDNDLTMSLGMRRGGVRSHFLPGGAYDYRGGDRSHKVGTNYPPRVKKTLEWLAGGGHRHPEMGFDIHDDDKDAIQMMAKNMVKHGIEGTIDKLRGKGMNFFVNNPNEEPAE